MSLPEGLKWLQSGFWVIHILSILLVYAYAYRRGRLDERRDARERPAARGGS